MTVTRPGETPSFYDYPITYALVSNDAPIESWSEQLKEMDPISIIIPPYQRKIVWKEKNVKELIDSDSVLFGTIILASESTDKPLVLLDGLQRFATATAIINVLYPLVLSPNPSMPNHKDNFELLKAYVQNFQPIFQHNDKMLKEHSRRGIASSYKKLYIIIESIINEELEKDAVEFGKKIKQIFINKQIAIDTYYGFRNRSELTHTFINMNSTGLDLKEVDLLRSEIIQKAEMIGWNADDIEDIENEFTRIFQEKISAATILGKHLYDAHEKNPAFVFEKWNSLQKDDVQDLLIFIERITDESKPDSDGKLNYPYLYEIFECGDLPYAITVWYFFKFVYLEGNIPDFLGGSYDTQADCRILLRSFYRRIIDGTIGRIGPTAAELIQRKGNLNNASDIASRINAESNAGGLDSDPDEGWLFQRLRKIEPNKARRVFNACLLPERRDLTSSFEPKIYGIKTWEWNIDHLIPKSTIISEKPGEEEGDQLPNLAPLTAELNTQAKNYPCEQKLRPTEMYSKISRKHPYTDWLGGEHYEKYKTSKLKNGMHSLDAQSCLVVNSEFKIGDDRIKKIYEIIKSKI